MPLPKHLKLPYQKDLHVDVKMWKVRSLQFPDGDEKRIPMAVLVIESGGGENCRYEITFQPPEESAFGYSCDFFASRVHNLHWDIAGDFFRDLKTFEAVTHGQPKELKFPMVLDKILENGSPMQRQEDLNLIYEARKKYFELLEVHFSVTGKARPWNECGPKIT